MEVWGKLVMKDEEKADVLNAFIASAFHSKISCPRGIQSPEPEDRNREQNEDPKSKGKWSLTCYTT